MTRETKILWTSQGFWNTNPHVHQRSVDRVMEAQTQAEYDPHGWAYLHADNTKCHAGAGRGPRGHMGTPTVRYTFTGFFLLFRPKRPGFHMDTRMKSRFSRGS